MQEHDLSNEEWREYDFGGRVYRIENPVRLWVRPGGTTHRIEQSDGVVVCLPAPGHCGCVLRWKQKPGTGAVSF